MEICRKCKKSIEKNFFILYTQSRLRRKKAIRKTEEDKKVNIIGLTKSKLENKCKHRSILYLCNLLEAN